MSDANCDSETRSAVDIKLGLPRYFACPEADVLVWRYRINGGALQQWIPGDPNPEDLFEHVRNGGRIRAWNAMFEWACWNVLCRGLYGWPELPIGQLVDTMAEAAAMNLPQSLGKCGEAVGLPSNQQKDKRGKFLINKLCKPQKITKHQKLRWFTEDTHPALFQEMYDYCGQDVVAEESVQRKLRPLTAFEQNIWLLTQEMNQKGVPVALDEVANIASIVAQETDRLNEELREITRRPVDGVAMPAVHKASARVAMLKWINQHPRLSGLDPVWFEEGDVDEEESEGVFAEEEFLTNMKGATIDTVLDRVDLPDDVRRVLEIRRQVCQTSTAKFPKLLRIAADDATLKGMHTYHGAGPGRWASRGGFNVQNLTRPTLSKADIASAHALLGSRDHEICSVMFGDELMKAATCCLRGIIKAPEGYEFLDADYSSVENRVAAWISGQDDKLAMFAAGLDEYKTFASRQLFHCEYDEVTPDQRQKTKPVILGGIFGLGAEGLVVYAKQYKVEMTLPEARENIKALRLEYDKVQACWYACGDAMLAAVREPGKWQSVGDKLAFIVHKSALWLKLPSGRLISWSRPRIDNLMVPWKEKKVVGYDVLDNPITIEVDVYKDVVTVESVDTFTRQWKRHKLIGSSAFQSAVQATARDILANGLVNLTEADYDVRMLVHDEALALVRAGEGSEEEFGGLMIKPAVWFNDLPLAYEAWRGPRFRK